MYHFSLLAITLLLLIGTAFLTALNAALRRLHLQSPNFEPSSKYLFYRPFHLFFFPDHEYEGILCATISAQNITKFLYAILSLPLIFSNPFLSGNTALLTLSIISFIFILFLIGDYIPRIIGFLYAENTVQFCAPLCSVFMFISFPITLITLKSMRHQLQSISLEEPVSKTKREIIDIIQKTTVSPEINLHERNLIESVLRFKDRIAREIMVPRVDVFSLPADTTIRDAAKLTEEEGYSRVPIYRNNVDNIVGVLMYKDVIKAFMEYANSDGDDTILDAPIESIQKNILYTPETKKISNLLLEFKKKQVHLAIVVDEYGGTEGIVTIEDILEEIVGEIEDEYDIEEEELFFPQHDGSWVVDARMSILDIEQQMGVKIPQEADYDTLGGYIFHCAGSIPTKGFVIHKEEFQIEILSSDERRVEKVRVKPLIPIEDEPEETEVEEDDTEESKKGDDE